MVGTFTGVAVLKDLFSMLATREWVGVAVSFLRTRLQAILSFRWRIVFSKISWWLSASSVSSSKVTLGQLHHGVDREWITAQLTRGWWMD
jgi:hypothetical protein